MAPMLLVMWFFMLRPNQKREKERQAMLAGLSKGDKVIMASGIIGSIIGVTDKTVVLRVSEEPIVKMEFLRGSVSRVVKDEKESK
ncbi:MAG: preprotein translocase subunit YajC [Candidatus Hydrogenedentes bacterium]|nr:preprotein translocase subunit YajC [Candidatus Hydrogenedentota bacterium]